MIHNMIVEKQITIPTLKRIDNIFHISDIHIRNTKRHEEYNSVFDNLCKEIQHENSINFVCGDVVHAKTQMSPELIQVSSNFLYNITKINPTFVIMGNHDANLNNSDRLDALQPIIDNVCHDTYMKNNLFYLKESGIYTINNEIDFVVFSLLDNIKVYNEIIELYKTNYKHLNRKSYAVYHGTINGAKTDTGYTLTNEVITKDMFNLFDNTMLGDIHKYQII